ncbi:unnamed protein product, partial [Symbiodinium sp. CCMP2592]
AIYKTQAKQLPTFDAALEHLKDDQVQQLSDMHVQIMQENQRQAEGPCQELAYIADFTMEEKEEFEEVCKVCFCKPARGNGKSGVAQNTPLASATVSAEPRSSDVGKGSDNGPIA